MALLYRNGSKATMAIVNSLKESPTVNEGEIKVRITQAVVECVSQKLGGNKRTKDPVADPVQNKNTSLRAYSS
jgi:hypothetical protein